MNYVFIALVVLTTTRVFKCVVYFENVSGKYLPNV